MQNEDILSLLKRYVRDSVEPIDPDDLGRLTDTKHLLDYLDEHPAMLGSLQNTVREHLLWLRGESKSQESIDFQRREAAVQGIDALILTAQTPAKATPAEALLSQVMAALISQSATTVGGSDQADKVVEQMMKSALEVAAKRRFLHGLYDLYVNAALASGLPDGLLPQAIGDRGGQDGGRGDGAPSAP